MLPLIPITLARRIPARPSSWWLKPPAGLSFALTASASPGSPILSFNRSQSYTPLTYFQVKGGLSECEVEILVALVVSWTPRKAILEWREVHGVTQWDSGAEGAVRVGYPGLQVMEQRMSTGAKVSQDMGLGTAKSGAEGLVLI